MYILFERHPLFPRRSRFSFAVRIFPLFKAFLLHFFSPTHLLPSVFGTATWHPVRSAHPATQALRSSGGLTFPFSNAFPFKSRHFGVPFGKSRDPKFWILFGLPPEPSAHRAIRIHPNSVLIISLTSHLLLSLIKQKGKGRYILSSTYPVLKYPPQTPLTCPFFDPFRARLRGTRYICYYLLFS